VGGGEGLPRGHIRHPPRVHAPRGPARPVAVPPQSGPGLRADRGRGAPRCFDGVGARGKSRVLPRGRTAGDREGHRRRGRGALGARVLARPGDRAPRRQAFKPVAGRPRSRASRRPRTRAAARARLGPDDDGDDRRDAGVHEPRADPRHGADPRIRPLFAGRGPVPFADGAHAVRGQLGVRDRGQAPAQRAAKPSVAAAGVPGVAGAFRLAPDGEVAARSVARRGPGPGRAPPQARDGVPPDLAPSSGGRGGGGGRRRRGDVGRPSPPSAPGRCASRRE
jgi:hypothetical protein